MSRSRLASREPGPLAQSPITPQTPLILYGDGSYLYSNIKRPATFKSVRVTPYLAAAAADLAPPRPLGPPPHTPAFPIIHIMRCWKCSNINDLAYSSMGRAQYHAIMLHCSMRKRAVRNLAACW